MGRARQLKPDFFFDEDLAVLPFEARLCFAGLWTIADKKGRLEDRPQKIKALLFPYDPDINVDALLNALAQERKIADGPFINRYTSAGKSYIQINNFEKHQRPHPKEQDSEIPDPPRKKRSCREIKRQVMKKTGRAVKNPPLPSSPSLPSGSTSTGSLDSPNGDSWKAGITWDKERLEVCFGEEAREGLRKHLEQLAAKEKLRMSSKQELQEYWGRLNTHLLGNRHKTGPKTLPELTVRWFENDLRKYGKQRGARASPDAMGLTGQHENPDYAEEIAACVEKHGADIHTVANLITSGEKSLMRWCKHQCGFAERKT